MIELALIGIGTGSPDHLTAGAIEAIAAADLILIPLKGQDKAELAGFRLQLCRRFATRPETRVEPFAMPERDPAIAGYLARVEDWHDAIAAIWQQRIQDHLRRGGGPRVALLVWGDPSLYDSSLRIARRVARRLPMRLKVIAGITAIQALCAAHAITLNEPGQPVTITTGRRLREQGWPAGSDTVVVMLDGGCAFDGMAGVEGARIRIWWGAYLGLAQQVLVAGPLPDVAARIRETRRAARAAHGWIMDIYLMRRLPRPPD